MVTEQLAQRGIVAPRVLDAMRRIPRERFVLPALAWRAYEDSALPIDCDQTISQPYMVARMTELLELEPDSRVLEIGTGSGYQTAVLALLAGEVYTIEWHLKLLNQAADRLESLGLTNVTFRCCDGSQGWPERAPYDAIIVTAGAPGVPACLADQLRVGGRLVIPTGPLGDQTLERLRRTEAGLAREELFKCRFVKLLGQEGWSD
ncbi:MAG: protein-L-isoaspartate(D-aspartate) O-methyltransferase [Phycisphaerales bacterium]|nr:protein-L-isoaspartate(D-aspartate) O-methyltransferase [Phycisphaerales bacterium]